MSPYGWSEQRRMGWNTRRKDSQWDRMQWKDRSHTEHRWFEKKKESLCFLFRSIGSVPFGYGGGGFDLVRSCTSPPLSLHLEGRTTREPEIISTCSRDILSCFSHERALKKDLYGSTRSKEGKEVLWFSFPRDLDMPRC